MPGNIIEDIYLATYQAARTGHPVHLVFAMPSSSGKSLTAFRYYGLSDVLVSAGDTTAQSIRKKFHQMHTQNSISKMHLWIIEDWSKLREKVKEGIAAMLSMCMSGMYTMDQEGLNITPQKMTASTIINVPSSLLQDVTKTLAKTGAGNRYIVIQTELDQKMTDELELLGIQNANRILKPLTPTKPAQIDFLQFFTEHKNNGFDKSLLNFAYGCECVREGLFDEILKINKNKIKEIEWDAWSD